MKLVEKKAKAGEGKTVVEPEEEAPQSGGEVIDLTALLKRSLKGGATEEAKSPAKKAPAKKKKAKKAAAKKTPAKAAPQRKAA